MSRISCGDLMFEHPPTDFGVDFRVRKSVHAAQRGPLVPLAVSPRIVSALLDGTAPAAHRTTLARGPLGN
jgi:hypothetical protein